MKKLLTTTICFLAIVSFSLADMTLLEWIHTQDTRDTVKLRNLATTKPVESDTPQPPIDVPRAAYSHEVVIRDIVVDRYGPLSDYAGLTPKARFDLLRARMDAAYAAGDQTGKNQAMFDATTIKSVNDMAKDEGGGMSHPLFLHPTISVPQADIIVYGQSPSEEYGFDVSCDLIEEALRNQ